MSKKLYEEANIQNIANAIREKNGEETIYKVSEMAQAILDIDGGTGDMPNLDEISFGNDPTVDNPGYTNPQYYEDIADAINYAIEHGGESDRTELIPIGELFHYIVLSDTVSDKFQRHDRYFIRSSNEPIIVISAMFLNDPNTIHYTGYGVISFSSSAPAGTYASYGDLIFSDQFTTPKGTDFYVYQMYGQFPPTEADGFVDVYLDEDSSYKHSVRLKPNPLTLAYNCVANEIIGDQNLINLLYEYIDAVYEEYYANQ